MTQQNTKEEGDQGKMRMVTNAFVEFLLTKPNEYVLINKAGLACSVTRTSNESFVYTDHSWDTEMNKEQFSARMKVQLPSERDCVPVIFKKEYEDLDWEAMACLA